MKPKFEEVSPLCLSESPEERHLGRAQLQVLMTTEGIDCNYLLGRSYE